MIRPNIESYFHVNDKEMKAIMIGYLYNNEVETFLHLFG